MEQHLRVHDQSSCANGVCRPLFNGLTILMALRRIMFMRGDAITHPVGVGGSS
jgi:hypothetical protein